LIKYRNAYEDIQVFLDEKKVTIFMILLPSSRIAR